MLQKVGGLFYQDNSTLHPSFFLQVALPMIFEFVRECLMHHFTDAFTVVFMQSMRALDYQFSFL
jgi:hypothetical protein